MQRISPAATISSIFSSLFAFTYYTEFMCAHVLVVHGTVICVPLLADDVAALPRYAVVVWPVLTWKHIQRNYECTIECDCTK